MNSPIKPQLAKNPIKTKAFTLKKLKRVLMSNSPIKPQLSLA